MHTHVPVHTHPHTPGCCRTRAPLMHPHALPRVPPKRAQHPKAWHFGGARAVTPPPVPAGISPTVKKTEMDKSPFNSPSPQDSSPRLSSFTQHHRPVIAVHSGERGASAGPARGSETGGSR